MPDQPTDLQRFEEFLASLDMGLYRERYSRIRTVELNLPRNIQAIGDIYQQYWDKRDDWPGYDAFYQTYYESKAKLLEEFRDRTGFSAETFEKGLPARIYRTWSPILTQIQCGYLAEDIFGAGNVRMSEELDRGGVDIEVMKGNQALNFQVKKASVAGVRGARPRGSSDIEIHDLEYEVPGDQYKKDGEERKPYKDWKEHWQKTGKLEAFPNSFVVFRRGIFEDWAP